MAKMGHRKATAKIRDRTTCRAGRARILRADAERDGAADFMKPPGKGALLAIDESARRLNFAARYRGPRHPPGRFAGGGRGVGRQKPAGRSTEERWTSVPLCAGCW